MSPQDAVNTFDLVRKAGSLPTKLEDLVPLSFIGSAAIKFYKAKIEAMKQLGMAEEQRAATLSDGQGAGECLLSIEARIGELARDTPVLHAPGAGRGAKPTGEPPKHDRLGLGTRRRMQTAESIARHPEAVKQVIAEARENEDIPTKTAVLNEIKRERREAKGKEKEQEHVKSLSAMRADEQKYLTDLLRAINLISDPPRELSEEGAKRLGEGWRLLIGQAQKFLQLLEIGNETKELD